MDSCIFLLLLFSIFTWMCRFADGSCSSYSVKREPWRHATVNSVPPYKDDLNMIGKWWRFEGDGGDIIAIPCILSLYGGGQNSITTLCYDNGQCNTGVTTTDQMCYTINPVIESQVCPGNFRIYKPLKHPTQMGYSGPSVWVTAHSNCSIPDVCGTSPNVTCNDRGLCTCRSGYKYSSPTAVAGVKDYPCVDIDECLNPNICGPNSVCTNINGGFKCACSTGFNATDGLTPPKSTNPCTDLDECLEDVCGENEDCLNSVGSFNCECITGYENVTGATPPCQDIDECLDTTICGPNSVCTNLPGSYSCSCQEGFSTFNTMSPESTNPCQDIEECMDDPDICGPEATCKNTFGFYNCTCTRGYRPIEPTIISSDANPCTDIDECSETPDLCGYLGVCTNVPGLFYCTCQDGAYPSTGVLWDMGETYCRAISDILDEIVPLEGQTKEMTFLLEVHSQVEDIVADGGILSEMMVAACFSACMEVAGVGPRAQSVQVSSTGDGETGTVILDIAKLSMNTLIPPDENQTAVQLSTPTLELTLNSSGPRFYKSSSASLSARGNLMNINLESLGKNNNGSAAAAFLVLNGMESLLSHQYFETENQTEMVSDVITAVLPKMNNTELTEPVNFTVMYNTKSLPESGLVSCVYWNVSTQHLLKQLTGGADDDEEAYRMSWSEEGCWVAHTNENYTVCSCSHLSTFALIMQIGQPPPQSDFLDWLNRICVIIGLFFFALAILTFLLCSWNPKINNTARLHLCLNLGLSHLLLLINDKFVVDELACKSIAGILHFLVIASFVWMLLEAVQLFILVRRLNKVQVIERDGLPVWLLFLIGYGAPLVIVGVSALVYSAGYGATGAKVCWLSQERSFNWALTGPVIAVLVMNFLLFGATLWSLRTILANMRSGASDSKETKLVLFKIVAQFVILGCTWILGLYQTNLFFQILFIVLNSQQGTFLYFVHCVLNKEIREECLKWLTCSHNKEKQKMEEETTTEQMDKTKQQT